MRYKKVKLKNFVATFEQQEKTSNFTYRCSMGQRDETLNFTYRCSMGQRNEMSQNKYKNILFNRILNLLNRY